MRTHAKLYVMRRPDGLLKLGHSRHPELRKTQLGIRDIEVVHETDVIAHAERTERLAHRVLALHGKHVRGEWFEATLNQAIEAISIAVRQAEAEELNLGGKLKLHVHVPSEEELQSRRESATLVRAARAYLGWSRNDLATIAGTSVGPLIAFETGRTKDTIASTMWKWYAALKNGGLEFIDEDENGGPGFREGNGGPRVRLKK